MQAIRRRDANRDYSANGILTHHIKYYYFLLYIYQRTRELKMPRRRRVFPAELRLIRPSCVSALRPSVGQFYAQTLTLHIPPQILHYPFTQSSSYFSHTCNLIHIRFAYRLHRPEVCKQKCSPLWPHAFYPVQHRLTQP